MFHFLSLDLMLDGRMDGQIQLFKSHSCSNFANYEHKLIMLASGGLGFKPMENSMNMGICGYIK
jgi:hypothetical protein